ncbi:hypothetical protein AAK706_12100 [Erysipelotrichaceae bacterium 66-17]
MITMLIPLVGMIRWETNETSENITMVQWPGLIENGTMNVNVLNDMGSYFENHFAFRNELINIYSLLNTNLLHYSPVQKVILGKNNWLYFKDTLDDYMGLNVLTEREIYCITNNLELMKNYVEGKGVQFIVTIPPNKNTLYGENMPPQYLTTEQKNIDQLKKSLKEKNIQYVDLFDLFNNEEDIYYFERDSHWNNEGALLAYNSLMDEMGIQHETYENKSYEVMNDHIGDLDEMLFPRSYKKEEDHSYEKWFDFKYQNDVKDNMDNWIETFNPSGQGTLLMYRDSFGEAILPYFANAFEYGYFSRLVPYNLTQIESLKPTSVLIERVERRLSSFAESAAIIIPQPYEIMKAESMDLHLDVDIKKEGDYINIKGTIDQNLLNDYSDIYIQVIDQNNENGSAYKAFYLLDEKGNGNGYQLYLPDIQLPDLADIQVLVYDNGHCIQIADKTIEK